MGAMMDNLPMRKSKKPGPTLLRWRHALVQSTSRRVPAGRIRTFPKSGGSCPRRSPSASFLTESIQLATALVAGLRSGRHRTCSQRPLKEYAFGPSKADLTISVSDLGARSGNRQMGFDPIRTVRTRTGRTPAWECRPFPCRYAGFGDPPERHGRAAFPFFLPNALACRGQVTGSPGVQQRLILTKRRGDMTCSLRLHLTTALFLALPYPILTSACPIAPGVSGSPGESGVFQFQENDHAQNVESRVPRQTACPHGRERHPASVPRLR